LFEKRKAFQTGDSVIPLAIIFTVIMTAFTAARFLSKINFRFASWWVFICIPFPLYLILIFLNKISHRSSKINPVLADHLQLAFPPIITILFLYLTGGGRSSFRILFLLPVIFYSLRFGLKWGYAVSFFSTFVNFFFYLLCPEKSLVILEENIILSCTFFLFSWFIGNVAELEHSIKSQLTQKVTRDELTGFYNYQYFQKQLKIMIAAHKDDQGKIGLIVLDLDNFKLYSKLSSPDHSKILLQNITSAINNNLAEGDFAARYGEDEFVIVVPCQKTAEVMSKAEKIKEEIKACQSFKPNGWNMSASAGVALFPDHAPDFQKLLQKADEALYRAKALKGNRVQLYYPLFAQSSTNRAEKRDEFLSKARTLLSVINARDNYTYGHSERVLIYTQLILKKMQLHPLEKSAIEYAAFLHDIGKIKISGAVLNKSGLLAPQEQNILRKHPLYSGEVIKSLIETKNMPSILPLIIHHHERFDGQGFPSRLKGHSIPLGARIIAAANMFDNLIAEHPFKERETKTVKEGIELLREEKGGYFDPYIIDTFVDCLRSYIGISQLITWPEDLRRLVPAGYLPGAFLLGCHYIDFYNGTLHFVVKATAYLAAALANNEKCLYFMSEKSETVFLQELSSCSTLAGTSIRDKQLAKMPSLEGLWRILYKARFPLELKRILKELLDQAREEEFTSLRILLDGSALSLLQNQLLLWEKNLSWSIKDLEIVIICLYNAEQENPEFCRLLYQSHDEPLLNREERSENSESV
jgi:diguanylate cyclase (GGDEF)-like protein